MTTTKPLPALTDRPDRPDRPDCPRGCTSWAECDEPDECSAMGGPDTAERHGQGVCATGACIEPCGPTGGCTR